MKQPTWRISYRLPEGEFYPEEDKVFRAFELPLHKVKVVILGQDPYHDGSATGLAFDNYFEKAPSPSLKRINMEMHSDLGSDILEAEEFIKSGSWLGHLPSQGVLLLNTALTVAPHSPGSHTDYWKDFTKSVIEQINQVDDVVWILWGKHAQSFRVWITNETHFIIESGHPSPLGQGAKVPFFGSKPFSRTNAFLKSKGKDPILW